MPKDTLQTRTIAYVANQIREKQAQLKGSESDTRKSLVNPILDAYGWKTDDPGMVRQEQGHAQPGRPDYTLIDQKRNVAVAPVEVKKLGSPELLNLGAQIGQYTDGAGKNARIAIATDGDKWIFRRPGAGDHEKPLAEVQISQDKPEAAAQTLTRLLRPSSIIGPANQNPNDATPTKADKELNSIEARPDLAPDPRHSAYCVIDVETTGFSSEHDKIIEVGAIKIVNGQEVDSFQTFVDPERSIPPQIQTLTGITYRETNGAPKFDQVRDRVQQFIGNHPVIAHNAAFDKRMLVAHGIDPGPNEWFDTMKLSRRIDQDEDSHSLENITKRLGIYQEGNHRADADARLTGKTFWLLMEKARTMNTDRRSSLVRETSRRGQGPEGGLLRTAGLNLPSAAPTAAPTRARATRKRGSVTPNAGRRPIGVK